ncbi:MAG: family 43 glycosylhydrolase [Oliverpabstia sp.]
MNSDKMIVYNKPWIEQRADPYIILSEDGWYYFTASVPAYDKIILRRARTLGELPFAEEKTIWTAHESGPMSFHVWAPELHYLFGKWYIYFAASQKEDIWALRPYVLECAGEDPYKDPWAEKGIPERAQDDGFSFNDFSLDGTVFENHGKWYYIWAEKVNTGKKISNLYIAEMESATKLKTAQVLLTTPDYDWERVGFWVNEGPGIIKHKDKIYLTFSASETGICYCVGLMSISADEDPLDPHAWKKNRYPILQSDETHCIYGPGHNSFTVDEDGNDIVVYHARTETEIEGDPLYNPNRHTMLMKLRWTDEGEPVFSYEE